MNTPSPPNNGSHSSHSSPTRYPRLRQDVHPGATREVREDGLQTGRRNPSRSAASKNPPRLPAHRKGQALDLKTDEALTKAATVAFGALALFVWATREIRGAVLHRRLRKPL